MYTVSIITSETICTNTEAQTTNDLCIPLVGMCSGGAPGYHLNVAICISVAQCSWFSLTAVATNRELLTDKLFFAKTYL